MTLASFDFTYPNILAAALFLGLFSARNGMEWYYQTKTSVPARPEKSGRLSLLILSLGFLLAGTAASVFLLFQGAPLALYSAGLLICCAGYAGRRKALQNLADSYSPYVCRPPRLITTGWYRYVRHPLYALYLVEMLGILLVRVNWVSLAAMAAVLAATLYRIRAEEQLLAAAFGEEFHAYHERSGCLLPYFTQHGADKQ